MNVVILRGPSGCGKTTYARKLLGYFLYSADLFFVIGNEYKFDPNKISVAHEWCYDRFTKALSLRRDIVVDNTNIRIKHFAHYINTAKEFGYTISILVVNKHLWDPQYLANINRHNVPLSYIQRHIADFENHPDDVEVITQRGDV